ncbi:hypothetical protein SLEP1_g46884 [Rubroshorea leprosula]|uniref:No apical meristem-associated C-terminal domain-containing protein n=1 Tax=Rubroshorea leprosula TaxID=152421 RepID=A0AAV5LPJ4_9ROSI|nr:hypothetical protein SLEP1_g46884 [Rubroshorea leprosula]
MHFVGFYSQVSQGRRGRMSVEDIINRAHQLYGEEIGKKFLLKHAWRLLKDEPKWKACHDTSGNSCSCCKRMKVSESGAYMSSSNPDTPGEVGVSEECEVQPIDGKAVKRR